MACFHPLVAYQVVQTGAVVFSPPPSAFLDLKLPCGQCVGCRLERSRQWAVRCMHEASLHELNCFITLTYDNEHLPAYGSLDVPEYDSDGKYIPGTGAFQLFIKRLRKACGKVRYYHAGEYGERFGRPHYHACLFGFDFPDKVSLGNRKGFPVWRSPLLESLWPYGRCEVGSVTFESAAYVARYIMKKVTGKNAEAHYERVDADSGECVRLAAEYTTMSRRPGIGARWLSEFASEVYPADSVLVRGRLAKPPRFYDLAYELVAPGEFERVRAQRREARRVVDLVVAEECAIARIGLKTRGLE